MKNQSSLQTGAGRALIQFKDGTKFILERDSQITFNASGGFTIENGSGYMECKKYGQKIILETRRGKFAIVGTTVSWEVDDFQEQFKVIEGDVEASTIDGSDPLMLTAGEQVVADESGLSEARDLSSADEQERWQTIEEEIIAAEAADNNNVNTSTSGTNYWWWVVGAVVLAVFVLLLIVIIAIVVLAGKRQNLPKKL